jgi:hypothetical protein
MALSEREQAILSEIELSLRIRRAPGFGVDEKNERPSHRSVIGAIGLVLGGLTATAVGLAMQTKVGDGVSVLGFVLIVGAAHITIRRTSSLIRRTGAHLRERMSLGPAGPST